MEKDGKIENLGISRSSREGSEFLTDKLVDTITKEALEKHQYFLNQPNQKQVRWKWL